MFHIPAHKNISDPPAQWINREHEDKPVYEVREPDPPPYKVDKPTEQPE